MIGRYALFDELAAGGMATVHLGRLLGPVGFGRTVAIKRLHAHFLKDEEFLTMFMDEARIVARIRHPNVVQMADVVQSSKGLFLIMEYVHGEALSRLMRTARKNSEQIPPPIVAAIICGVLLGLHAAHDTKAADGTLLGVVHRDVSPQNIIVGADGSARVLDFGIAKAAGRAQITREGQIKGKLAYMAPEQIRGQVDRRTDVFAASVVLWEMLAGRRLHEGSKEVDIVTRVVKGNFPPPSQFLPALGPELDALVMRGLANDPKQRFASARELALELERKVGLASPSEVSAWVERLAKEVLEARANLVTAMELAAGELIASESNPPPPSLVMGASFVPPIPADIPVHIDESSMSAPGEVPSTSAVFAHTQTPYAVPTDAMKAQRNRSLAQLVFALSALLALLGVVLGTYALVERAARARSPRIIAPSARPAVIVAPPTGSAPGEAPARPERLPPKPAASVAPAGSGTGTGTGTGTGSAVTTAPVAPPPAPIPRAPAKPKPNCDPPYTVDDVGHRHYKPECMGLD